MCARHDHPPYDSDWAPPYPDHPDDAGLMGEPELAAPHPATEDGLREALDAHYPISPSPHTTCWHCFCGNVDGSERHVRNHVEQAVRASLAATPPASAEQTFRREYLNDFVPTPPASADDSEPRPGERTVWSE